MSDKPEQPAQPPSTPSTADDGRDPAIETLPDPSHIETRGAPPHGIERIIKR